MNTNSKTSEEKDNKNGSKNLGRRRLLKTSALGLASLTLPTLDAAAKSTSSADSIPDGIIGSNIEITSELSPTQTTIDTMDTAGSSPVKGVYELTKNDGDVGFLIAGTNTRLVEYDLTINPDEYWYEIDSIEKLNQYNEIAATDNGVSTNGFSSYSVQITQHDPFEVKLCRTKQTLKWTHNGSRVTFQGHNRNGTKAWNPTGGGTNWYEIYDKWVRWGYLINRRGLLSISKAKFYNTDFPLCGRTEVKHKLGLYGYGDGNASHYPQIWRSGCAHELLHSHTRVV